MKSFFKLYWDNIKIGRNQIIEIIKNLVALALLIILVAVIMLPTLLIADNHLFLGVGYFIVSGWLSFGILQTISDL